MSWPGSHTSGRFLPGFLILVTLLGIVFLIFTRQKKMNTCNEQGFNLYLLLIRQGFNSDLAKLITAQAAFETGNFTSPIYLFQNNPWGMKYPKSRDTTATAEARGHAVYSTLESAVQDYWLYYTYFKYPWTWQSVDDFVTALKEKKYFESPLDNYIKGVKKYHLLYFYA